MKTLTFVMVLLPTEKAMDDGTLSEFDCCCCCCCFQSDMDDEDDGALCLFARTVGASTTRCLVYMEVGGAKACMERRKEMKNENEIDKL